MNWRVSKTFTDTHLARNIYQLVIQLVHSKEDFRLLQTVGVRHQYEVSVHKGGDTKPPTHLLKPALNEFERPHHLIIRILEMFYTWANQSTQSNQQYQQQHQYEHQDQTQLYQFDRSLKEDSPAVNERNEAVNLERITRSRRGKSNEPDNQRNERERQRVKQVNDAFRLLRERLPNPSNSDRNEKLPTFRKRRSTRISKVKTLRAAIQYIKELVRILEATEYAEQTEGG